MGNEMLNKDVGQEVEPTASEQPFRSFATQKEFDDFSAHLIKKAEERALKTLKADLEVSIRADIEKQAKMSEQEKLTAERAKMEAEFKEQKIEINKEKAKNLLSQAGFEEDEMDVYLDFVTEDRDVSLGKIKRVCESRKANQEKLLSEWQTKLQTANPTVNIGNAKTITAEQANKMSVKERTELKKTNPNLYAALFKS